MDWKKMIAALLEVLARQGGTWALIALLLKPILQLADGTFTVGRTVEEAKALEAAPDDFKDAVKRYLLAMVDRVNRPLLKVLLNRLVTGMSDAILDQLWDSLFGTPKVQSTTLDDLGMAALDELATA